MIVIARSLPYVPCKLHGKLRTHEPRTSQTLPRPLTFSPTSPPKCLANRHTSQRGQLPRIHSVHLPAILHITCSGCPPVQGRHTFVLIFTTTTKTTTTTTTIATAKSPILTRHTTLADEPPASTAAHSARSLYRSQPYIGAATHAVWAGDSHQLRSLGSEVY